MGDGELTTVAAYGTLQDAEMARYALEAEGINAMVLGANTMSTLSYMLPAVAPLGVRVAVLPEDACRARQVLEEWEAEAPTERAAVRKHGEDATEAAEPAGAEHPAVAAAERAKRLAIISIPLPPLVVVAVLLVLHALLQPSPQDEDALHRYRSHLAAAALLCVVVSLVLLVLSIPIAALFR